MLTRPAPWSLVAIALVSAALLSPAFPGPALAADAGQIKVARGAAWIERQGARQPARVGAKVQERDVIATGPDGSVGITFADDTLLSLGPNSSIVIETFAFDPTTQNGSFESSLRAGTLSAVSGRLVRQSPDAMKVRTPGAILGVRGTEFLVRVGGPAE